MKGSGYVFEDIHGSFKGSEANGPNLDSVFQGFS
jgi:hypothetical protein